MHFRLKHCHLIALAAFLTLAVPAFAGAPAVGDVSEPKQVGSVIAGLTFADGSFVGFRYLGSAPGAEIDDPETLLDVPSPKEGRASSFGYSSSASLGYLPPFDLPYGQIGGRHHDDSAASGKNGSLARFWAGDFVEPASILSAHAYLNVAPYSHFRSQVRGIAGSVLSERQQTVTARYGFAFLKNLGVRRWIGIVGLYELCRAWFGARSFDAFEPYDDFALQGVKFEKTERMERVYENMFTSVELAGTEPDRPVCAFDHGRL